MNNFKSNRTTKKEQNAKEHRSRQRAATEHIRRIIADAIAAVAVNRKPDYMPGDPYSDAMGSWICETIAAGASIRELVAMPGTPAWETIRGWLQDHEQFAAQYARAREDQADALVDEMLFAARSVTPENANAVRVYIDSLKWIAAKRRPKVYGDKVEIDHKEKLSVLSDEQLNNRIAAVQAEIERLERLGGESPAVSGSSHAPL